MTFNVLSLVIFFVNIAHVYKNYNNIESERQKTALDLNKNLTDQITEITQKLITYF